MIKRLRALGGTWVAERTGSFGNWRYSGSYGGAAWDVRSYAHLAPRYDGDDETFVVRWHIERNGVPWGYPTSDPVTAIGAGMTDLAIPPTEAGTPGKGEGP